MSKVSPTASATNEKLSNGLITASNYDVYLEITPLFDDFWTGIPVVCASLARELLKQRPNNTHFFMGYDLISRSVVDDALRRNSGTYLARDYHDRRATIGSVLTPSDGSISVGLFPSVKCIRRVFDIECSIAHDLSTMLLPQFHTLENVSHHMEALIEDLNSNDVTFCVSRATLTDIVDYIGTTPNKLVCTYNGVSWPWWYEIKARNEVDLQVIEPYFLILGTREPRKNIVRLFDYLTQYPDILERRRFVFAGKMGWLVEQQRLPKSLEDAMASGRILFTGFVSDFEKYKLLYGAEASIYPSLFEGFGLPVLESLSVGTPCIASFSSSIPEAGGDYCEYFDPLSITDLHRAVEELTAKDLKRQPDFRAAAMTFAAGFSWTRMLAGMLNALEPIVARHLRMSSGGARWGR